MIPQNNQLQTDTESIYKNTQDSRIEILNSGICQKSKQLVNKLNLDNLETIPNQIYFTKKKNKINNNSSKDFSKINYYTKIINWYDATTDSVVQRTIVYQNESGSYPIIALANIIILQTSSKDLLSGHLSIDNSQISASSLLNIIANYIISNVSEEHLDNVLFHLSLLYENLNVNPCFKNSLQFDSPESKLFSALGVQLLHAWLPDIQKDGNDVYDTVIKTETYQNALEKIILMKELSENKNFKSSNDKKIFEGQLLNRFLCSYPNCLTPYGLTVLRTILSPGKLSILFHNLNFSLLYSHYQTGELYTLVTDYNYKDCENIVWESLEASSYFNSEFIPQNILCNDPSDIDNDFAFALNMQLMEDQQKENWVYHLSKSQEYRSKISNKHKEKKNNKSNNIVIPNWKKRNFLEPEDLNKDLQKEKKCIIF
ncbi:hypothetical protein PORY_002424 [Pneumocystis oryctolagi]|uniref:Uncharacterized protein n=1 Tax=Pneumocystis oryctolagi TaxID=42067 RepID=A0ACB7C9M1_9ASCO|nr:hypothetical protein PORY_002424 [Pneumocystis oryctolagi]